MASGQQTNISVNNAPPPVNPAAVEQKKQSYMRQLYNSTAKTVAKWGEASTEKMYKNTHNIMMIFGIIFFLIALIGFFVISGVQTGSSDNTSSGSMVTSSTGGQQDGEINPTAEVISEFLCILFLIIGIAMIVYAWTISSVQSNLFKEGAYRAALAIAGKTDVSEQVKKEATEAEVAKMIKDNPDVAAKLLGPLAVQAVVDQATAAKAGAEAQKAADKDKDD